MHMASFGILSNLNVCYDLIYFFQFLKQLCCIMLCCTVVHILAAGALTSLSHYKVFSTLG